MSTLWLPKLCSLTLKSKSEPQAHANQSLESQKIILPPEIHERIIREAKDEQSLLTYRFVNKFWSKIAGELLDQQYPKRWCQKPRYPLTDSVLSVELITGPEFEYYVRFPPTFNFRRYFSSRQQVNLKSVAVRKQYRVYCGFENTLHYPKLKWERYWQSRGSCITSIILYEVHVPEFDFYAMLACTPNLIAFTVYCSRVLVSNDNSKSLETQNVKVSPHLKYLQLHAVRSVPIYSFAHQLIRLSLRRFKMSNFIGHKFENLKQLRIFFQDSEEFEGVCPSVTFPNLAYLSIMSNAVDGHTAEENTPSLNFICECSNNLRYLCLDMSLYQFAKYLKVRKVVFNKLCCMVVGDVFPRGRQWKQALKSENVFCFFPNIKNVEFVQNLKGKN